MGQIIDFGSGDVIQTNKVRISLENLIAPADTDNAVEFVIDHTAEPIKSVADIDKISKYLIENGKYRDNMFFIVGINFGLRVSDLLRLRFSDLINPDFTFKANFPILEKKTRNTRKVKKNRYVTINLAVAEAVVLYLQHSSHKLDDFMFQGEQSNKSSDAAMSRMSADRIVKAMVKGAGVNVKASTHTLRKTFGYHQMLMSGNDPRKLLLLQKIFGHSSTVQTLEYIGITSEEIEDAYLHLNLGSKECYERYNKVVELIG